MENTIDKVISEEAVQQLSLFIANLEKAIQLQKELNIQLKINKALNAE